MTGTAATDTLGVLLLSGAHDRAHYAFVLASAASAVGQNVVLFAASAGCRAMLAEAPAMAGDAALRTRGVAGVGELRAACLELGVRMMACPAGLAMEAIGPADLLPGVEVAGVPSFLSAVRGGQVITV